MCNIYAQCRDGLESRLQGVSTIMLGNKNMIINIKVDYKIISFLSREEKAEANT